MTNGFFWGLDIPKFSTQGKRFHVSATKKHWLQLLQRLELQFTFRDLYKQAWGKKKKKRDANIASLRRQQCNVLCWQTIDHVLEFTLAGLVEITFSVRQSSFSFRAGVLASLVLWNPLCGKQPCIILQRSARAGLPSVRGSAPVFHFTNSGHMAQGWGVDTK